MCFKLSSAKMEETSENISREHGVREKPFACWIICDTEATGLKRRPRVTELCMLAVLTDELMSTTRPMPRVTNKLQLCFNPESFIQPDVSRLTGLYNDVLEQMGTFRDQASLITGFLASLPQPVCLIAHNGHRFDFPLLQSELGKADCSSHAQLYCADSLEAFRVLDGLPAIPEWVLQREKEEKLRKAKACDDSVTPCKVNSNATGSSVVFLTIHSPSAENTHCEDSPSKTASETISPNKRQVSCVGRSTDDPASLPTKLLRVDNAPTFGSQSSVSDSDLVQAYDMAIAEINAGDVDGAVMPGHAVADRSLQSAQETTPEKDPSWTSANSVPDPVVKRPPPPLSVNFAQREKVSRRLFVEEADTEDKESLHNHVKDDSHGQKIAEQGETPENSVSVHSSQGSLSDKQIVQAVAGVASLMPRNSGAGGDPIHVSEGRNAQTNQHLRLGEQQQQSCDQDQAQTACEGNKDTSAVKTHLSALSTQNQIPDVTSSSAAVPTQPVNKTSPNAAPSSSTTPKVSYKLTEIYRRQFGRCPDSAHHAEDDCLSLLKVIMTKKSEFMAYVEKHAVMFDSVQPMY